MPKFQVQIGRSTTVYHTATIEAESLEALQEGRASDIVDLTDEWKEPVVDEPERLEVVNIMDEDGSNALARWTDGEGWEE